MLKPGFGTKDAPWAWAMELRDTLRSLGLQPSKADPLVYLLHVRGCLVLAVSTHVDDLKGCGEEDHVAKLFACFTSRYGKTKRVDTPFDHCGV